jgi:acetyltransferase-like isoleucine patch superfamily enzyme
MSAAVALPHDWFPRPLPENVSLGARSWCYSAFSCAHYRSGRPGGVRVGNDSGIYHGTFFDLGPEGEVEIGSYCALVGAIIATNGRVVIGDYCFLAHEVVIADGFAAVPGGDASASVGGPGGLVVELGENVWVGARAVLLRGARLGDGVIVGAAAVVDFPVPAGAIVAGNPARVVGWAKPGAGTA